MSTILANEPEREIQLSKVTGRCMPCGGLGKRDEFSVCPDCGGTGADRAAIDAALAHGIYFTDYLHNCICLLHGNAWDVSLELAYNTLKTARSNLVGVEGPDRPFLTRKFEFVDIKGKEVMQETRYLDFYRPLDEPSDDPSADSYECFWHSPKPLLHYRSDAGDSWHSYTILEPMKPIERPD